MRSATGALAPKCNEYSDVQWIAIVSSFGCMRCMHMPVQGSLRRLQNPRSAGFIQTRWQTHTGHLYQLERLITFFMKDAESRRSTFVRVVTYHQVCLCPSTAFILPTTASGEGLRCKVTESPHYGIGIHECSFDAPADGTDSIALPLLFSPPQMMVSSYRCHLQLTRLSLAYDSRTEAHTHE